MQFKIILLKLGIGAALIASGVAVYQYFILYEIAKDPVKCEAAKKAYLDDPLLTGRGAKVMRLNTFKNLYCVDLKREAEQTLFCGLFLFLFGLWCAYEIYRTKTDPLGIRK